ncbi:MAG: peptidylprolyl isomerase, partial [Elusimicrobiota bacterium]
LKLKVYERELENGVSEIRKRFSRSPDGGQLTTEKAEEAFRGELRKEGVTLEEFRERIRRQLMVQKLVQDTIKARAKMPGDAETKAYFDNISLILKGEEASIKGLDTEAMQDLLAVAGKFKEITAERLRLRHILIKLKDGATPEEKKSAQEKALALRKELDGSLDFDEAAEKNSDDQESARRGGDLGYIVKGMLPVEVETVAFKLQVGENSQPVESRLGCHILRLEEKRAAQKLRYESVKEDLEQVLAQNSFAAELGSYIKELRKNAKIQVFISEKK